MACVRLPGPHYPNVAAAVEQIALEAKTAISLNRIGEADWLRVSASIYNELEDPDRLLSWLNRERRTF